MNRKQIVLGMLAGMALCAWAGGPETANGPLKIDAPLIAHWSFDEPVAELVLHGGVDKSGLEAKANRPVARTRGVYGSALDLRQEHALRVDGFGKTAFSRISFAAWTRPTDLRGFREIFRQECANRILFSYQDNGTVLSLGLNVGGYVECDAPIKPDQVMDGQWHHCAATFDGQLMRVYLDGKEIQSLKRPGKLALQSDVPGYIGSLGGVGEHFQGGLDDLRIYSAALSAEQIAQLHQHGRDELKRYLTEQDQFFGSVYKPGKTFAETMMASLKTLSEKGIQPDREFANRFFGQLRTGFPQETESFLRQISISPVDYLAAVGQGSQSAFVGRLIELMLEYKPLTEHQLQKQTPEDLRKWKEAGEIQERYAKLAARGDEVRFSTEWIDLTMAIGARIQFRPHEREAVAPYLHPETPVTKTLSATEGRESLERDWLFQADQKATPERIRSEIGWARQLAERIKKSGPDQVDYAKELAELKSMEKQAAAISAPDAALYFKVRELKRAIMFKNPVLDFNKVCFVDMPLPQGSEFNHETRHRLGYMAVPGARLLTLEGLNPDGKPAQLMPQSPLHGSFWRPDVSPDGRKVLFCFKPHNEKSFHLYEINSDGTGLKQLTDGPFDDLDPIYLPDGHILFSTTRAHSYVRCMPPTNAYVLARCDGDGRNIYLVSANNEPDYLPSVMNDGRVIYTRWEYTDKPLWRAQKLWTINPDGTQVNMFWGNQSVWPDVMKDVRSIPHSRRVMFTGCGHHAWFAGSVGIIDPDKGLNFPHGLTKVTADQPWPECGNGPVDPVESSNYHGSGHFSAYYSPYPLSEQDFLVSAQREGKFRLYLMDVDGNRELIYEGVNQIFHASPVRQKEKVPVIADRVSWPDKASRENPKHGVIFSSNIYQGAPAELRDKAKFLRIMHIEPKTYTYWYKRLYISTGPVVSAVQSEGVKAILGTVPIEPDGSVAFYAPPGKALHFQLLDAQQRALQTMRSFVGVMPGEYRGCQGCHESHSRSPETGSNSIALSKAPREITPPPWTDNTVSYHRYVRPVLDKYCGKCHEGDGDARKVLDLTERPAAPVFSEPYMTLIGRPSWGKPYKRPDKIEPGFGIAGMLMVEGYGTLDPKAYVTPKPMTALSFNSPLIEIASSGKHHGVKVDPVSLQRLTIWVDAMCPYRGDDEIRQEADPEFQGVDWLAIRPKISSAPRIARPGPVE